MVFSLIVSVMDYAPLLGFIFFIIMLVLFFGAIVGGVYGSIHFLWPRMPQKYQKNEAPYLQNQAKYTKERLQALTNMVGRWSLVSSAAITILFCAFVGLITTFNPFRALDGWVFLLWFVTFMLYVPIANFTMSNLYGLSFMDKYGGANWKAELEQGKTNIYKKVTAEGFGTLAKALNPLAKILGVGNPLLMYIENPIEGDDWNEKRKICRVTNEDLGLIVGLPGAGKTAYLIAQAIDWMRSGQTFVCMDIKPEIWGILKVNGVFEHFGYTDIVFNPMDSKAPRYNMFSEVTVNSDINEILGVIIPTPRDSDGQVFTDNARRVLKAVLTELGNSASLPAARSYINNFRDVEALLKELANSEKSSVANIAKEVQRIAANDRLMASIMTALTKAFEFLDEEVINDAISASDFSLKEALTQPKHAIFLQFEQQYKTTLETLSGAMVAHTMRILQNNAQDRRAVFVMLDEIINCAPIPKFTEIMSTIRSANMPTYLHLQSMQGLDDKYGSGASDLFNGATSLKVIFQIGDLKTAEYFAKQIGRTETEIVSTSSGKTHSYHRSGDRLNSASSDGFTKTTSTQTSMEYIVEPSELLQMPEGKAVILYKGQFGKLPMPQYYKDFPKVSQRAGRIVRPSSEVITN